VADLESRNPNVLMKVAMRSRCQSHRVNEMPKQQAETPKLGLPCKNLTSKFASEVA